MSNEDKVLIGDIVHYGLLPCAAMVIAVNADGTVDLLVYLHREQFLMTYASTETQEHRFSVPFSVSHASGHWSWKH